MHPNHTSCSNAVSGRPLLNFCFTDCCERSKGEQSRMPEAEQPHAEPADETTVSYALPLPRRKGARWTSTGNLDPFQGAFQPISF